VCLLANLILRQPLNVHYGWKGGNHPHISFDGRRRRSKSGHLYSGTHGSLCFFRSGANVDSV
jgi:hypothetical protein